MTSTAPMESSDDDLQDGLSILNPFPQPLPGPDLLHNLIAWKTRCTALEYHDETGLVARLTYDELKSAASSLAHSILASQRAGNAPLTIIPLLIPQCPALYISQIAILMTGAAFCPLNLDIPKDRLDFVLDDIAPPLILTTPELASTFKHILHIPILVLELDGKVRHISRAGKTERPGPSSQHLELPSVQTTNAAYIMYTSGSTGTPKAVRISHRAVTQSLLAHDQFLPPFSRHLQFANPTFDVSIYEIFFPLFRGATLVSCKRPHLLSDLPAVMTALQVDAAELTPSVVASLIRSRKHVPTLKLLLTIGEMLNPQTVREFAASDAEQGILYGMYGPTEAAIHCTLQSSFKQTDSINTIGMPLDTVSCFVVETAEDGRSPQALGIVKIGEVGELAVGGLQLADGYLNREEQTDAVFLLHPKFGRLYRTGDKARLSPHGRLECLGRISKGQVKLRGQRVELGEVEHAASRIDGVHASSASVIDAQLVLFCIADPVHVRENDIRAACQRWLPRFMVPSDIVILPDFPYLPSGKIDSKKLESDYVAKTVNSAETTSQTNGQQPQVVADLQAVLDEHFESGAILSSSGLDSLTAIKLATQLKRSNFPQLSAVDLLSVTSIQDLAALVNETSRNQRSRTSDASAHEDLKHQLQASIQNLSLLSSRIEQIFDVNICSAVQDAMLVETAKNPNAYCNLVTLALPSGTSYDDCKNAMKLLADRHGLLRTGFVASPLKYSAYLQIQWRALDDNMFSRVTGTALAFQITDEESLLHPFKVVFNEHERDPQAILCLHHALYDQWSLDVLVDDLYRAYQGDDLPPRPQYDQIPIQAHLRKQVRSSRKSLHSFWKSYMDGAVPTALPNLTGFNSSASHVSRLTHTSTTKIDDLSKLSARYGVSTAAIVQAAYMHLLALYAGQADATVGNVYSGRTTAIEGIEDMVGPLLTTLPVRTKMSNARSFEDVAKSVNESNRGIMAHTDMSLAQVKQLAGLDTSTPLFDSLFVWQGTSRERIQQNAVRVVGSSDFVEFKFVLEVDPSPEAMIFKATFRDRALPEQHVQILLDQIDDILTSALKQPEVALHEVLSKEIGERTSIYNPQPDFLDCSGGLPGLLARSFAQYSEHPAVLFAKHIDSSPLDSECLTFNELECRSNQLAQFLISNGVRPGYLIVVMMEKSLDLYVSVLAIIKTGCGYLPIVPGTPPGRLQAIFKESGVELVLCDQPSAEQLSAAGIHHYHLMADLSLAGHDTSAPVIDLDPQSVAYAVYTSGTTGKPKGVLVTHENISSNLLVLQEIYPVFSGSRLLQACNQAFDVSVFEIFFAWVTGTCLCFAQNDVLFRDIEAAIDTLKITHLSLTPTVSALIDPDNCPSVQFLVTAGEAVTPQVHRAWAGRGLYQGYGPSETTNICTVNPAVSPRHAINNIGPSFRNTSTFVLPVTGEFTPLPRGALGELCFGGQQVYKGYQNMPGLTAEKIINHSVYGRIYRSGDLGRMGHDGTILIEGRTDSQRKIRGQRIELDEIVSVLLQSEHVVDAAVLISGSSGQERLFAFWIPHTARDTTYRIVEDPSAFATARQAVVQALEANLPSYMIPSALVAVTSLPRTAQGKVATKRLLEDALKISEGRFAMNTAATEDADTELSELEQKLSKIATDTLGIDVATPLGRSTSLFGLGLDSISAIRLVSAIKASTGQTIDISMVLKRPRISQLADILDSMPAEASTANGHVSALDTFLRADQFDSIRATCKARNLAVDRLLPCTPLQGAMLSASLIQGAASYLNRTVLLVQVDVAELEDAWRVMVDRHDILRTVYITVDDHEYPYVQAILQTSVLPWKRSGAKVAVQDLLMQHNRDIECPTDSFEVPYQLSVCTDPSENHYLVVDMHHVMYDANAMDALLADVQSVLIGTELPKPTTFDPFLEHMLSQDSTKADTFFSGMLQGFSPDLFPLGNNAAKAFKVSQASLEVTTLDLYSYLEAQSVSLSAICQTAWAQVLSILQDNSRVCFGNVLSGRSVPVKGIEHLVAPCFNTVPLCVDISTFNDYLGLVEHVHRLNIDAFPHQLTPLRRIQRNHSGGRRLFDSLLLLQQRERSLDPSVWSHAGENGTMDFPCIMEVLQHESRISFKLHHRSDLLSDDKAGEVGKLFSDVIMSIVRYPRSDIWSSDTVIDNLIGLLKPRPVIDTEDIESSHGDEDWSPTEEIVRDAFHGLARMHVGEITRNTTIYRMGLDSISAIRVATKLKKQGLHVTSADILEHTTAAKLATYLDDSKNAPTTAITTASAPAFDLKAFSEKHAPWICDTAHLNPSDIETVRPCTPVQSGMLSAFLQSRGLSYLNHVGYELDIVQSETDIQLAWSQVVANHEMLRTGFVELEDREFSFAMVTYKTDSAAAATASKSIDMTETWEVADQTAILSNLAHPPWRWHRDQQDNRSRLYISIHHALYDARSWDSIMYDLHKVLGGEQLCREPSIDVALLHILNQVRLSDADDEFWKIYLADAAPTRFPNLNPVVPRTTRIVEASLQCSTMRSLLEQMAGGMDVSLQAVFQLGWAKVLAAYTGETKVTFGNVHSGRTTAETSNSNFPCINTLPLVCDTTKAAGQALADLAAGMVATQKRCFASLATVQSYSGAAANEALFDTIFAFQKDSPGENKTPWQLVHEKAAVDYTVSIEVEHSPEHLRLRATFDTRVLPYEQAETMLKQIDHFVNDVLNTMSDEDCTLASIVNPKDPIIPTDITLMQQFVDRTREEHPNKVAVQFVNELSDSGVVSQTWTYAELDKKASSVAHVLHGQGVRCGDVVGMSFDKCPEAAFAFLGILKAGCSILAIDATAPVARKQFMLSDSSATALLCSPRILAELTELTSLRIIDLADALMGDWPITAVNLDTKVTRDSVCYVLYTSGTTGTPKGCEITHENAVQALLAFQRLFTGRWTEDSAWLQFASYHFDVAILEHFWTWSVAMKLVCAPRDLILEDIAGFIDRLQITHLDLTPSLGRLLDPHSVPSLHNGVFITGGEAVKQEMLETWGDIGCLFNFYGPTECTIGVTTFPSVPTNGKASNIGWQFDNVGTCVLGPNSDQPVLRGGIGELCIFGKLVGKGYLNRPDLNKASFPFIESLGQRVYRTGDLVRLFHDNSIEFLGRADGQVKLRGQRLEIDEIVAVMLSEQEVKDAVCLVAKRQEGQGEQLVAFLSRSADRRQGHPSILDGSTAEDMIAKAKSACAARLAVYMVPTHYVAVDFIPLSVNNKQDDKLLRQMYKDSPASGPASGEARTSTRELNDTERHVVEILSAVLGTDAGSIDANSNIFALGMNSISAVQLARRLKSAGFANASIATVMQNAVITKLAAAMTKDTQNDDRTAGISHASQQIAACQHKHLTAIAKSLNCKPQDIERIAPCTPLQQGILYKSSTSGNGLYFNRFVYDIGNADVAQLESAFRRLVDTAEILRAAFIETDDGYVQAIRGTSPIPWRVTRLGPEEQPQDVLDGLHGEFVRANKQMLHQPIWVAALLGAQKPMLQVSVHHALYDGRSWDLIEDFLDEFYKNPDLKLEVPSFIDVLPYGPLLDNDKAQNFWRAHLREASIEPFAPIDTSSDKDVLVTRVIGELGNINDVSKRLQITPQALLQAAWLVTLAKYHAGPLGLIVSGQTLDIDISKIIGPLFNTIPFHWQLSETDTWTSLSKRCHDFNSAALTFQHTPLRDISRYIGRNASQPLFETLFVFQQQSSIRSSDRVLKLVDQERGYVADYSLSFEAEQRPDRSIQVNIGAQAGIADGRSLYALIDHFQSHLQTGMNSPESRVVIPEGYAPGEAETVSTKAEIRTNGFTGSFDWSEDAQVIRQELASLAKVPTDSIDEHTSIFSLGLDSIDAVKLAARLKKKSLVITVGNIMKDQTLSNILQHIQKKDAHVGNGTANSDEARKRTDLLRAAVLKIMSDVSLVEDIVPATPMQEALVSEMVQNEYKAYFNHDVLEIAPEIDLSKLEHAWRTVYKVSPILRTAFVPVEDPELKTTFAQVIAKPKDFNFMSIDGDSEPFELTMQKIQEEVAEQDKTTPPFRLTALKSKGKQHLILSMAHALYDGYSLGLLHADVQAAYRGKLEPRPSYFHMIENALRAVNDNADHFWQGLLHGVVPSQIERRDLDGNAVEEITHRHEHISTISAGRLYDFCRQQMISPQAACQTAWALVQCRLTNSIDVVSGLVLAGRNDEAAERLCFPTMNTVVTRVVVAGTVSDLLQKVQMQVLDIMPYQQTPLRHIQRLARQVGHLGGKPLFDSLFTYQKQPEQATNSASPLYKSIAGSANVDYPLAIEAEIVGDNIVWRIAAKNSIFDSKGTRAILKAVDNILEEMIKDSRQEILRFNNSKVSVLGQPMFDLVSTSGSEAPSAKSGDSTSNTASWSKTESAVRDAIARVTQISKDQVSKSSKLEELGIDSINVIKLASLLRKASLPLPVSKIISAGAVGAIAALTLAAGNGVVTKQQREQPLASEVILKKGHTASLFGVDRAAIEKILPASAGQVYLLSTMVQSKGTSFYPSFSYRLKGVNDVKAVQAAWQTIVSRHAILRTVFAATHDSDLPYVQAILKADYVERSRTTQLLANMTTRASNAGVIVELEIAHSLYDAVSLDTLIQELATITQGQHLAPASPTVFEDMLSMQVSTDSNVKQKKFWVEYLANTASGSKEVPYGGQRTEVFEPDALLWDKDKTNHLRQLGISTQVLFIAAYAQQYARLTACTGDVVIGTYLANRSLSEDLATVACPTLNLLPLVVRDAANADLLSLARQIRDDLRLISLEDNIGAGLWQIHAWTGVTVHTFVNFVKLPASNDDGGEPVKPVTITSLDQEREWRRRAQTNTGIGTEKALPSTLQGGVVDAAYPPSIDVEATVREGKLAMGVFGYESLVGLETAESIIADVSEALRAFFKE